jgi:hypothetical protein
MTQESFAAFPAFLALSPCSMLYAPSKILDLTAVFEEFTIMLTNVLASIYANDHVNGALYKVFSHGK